MHSVDKYMESNNHNTFIIKITINITEKQYPKQYKLKDLKN